MTRLLPLCIVLIILVGCANVDTLLPSAQVNQTATSEVEPKLVIEALDNSTPVGEAFPIRVSLADFPPSRSFSLSLVNGGIEPSETDVGFTTDAQGSTQLTISAKATRTGVVSLDALVLYESDLFASGTLYVTYDQPEEGALQTQAVEPDPIGEPISYKEYYEGLPQYNSFEQADAADSSTGNAVIIKNVQIKDEDGQTERTTAIASFNTPNVVVPGGNACTTERVAVNMRSMLDGAVVNVPGATRVVIRKGKAPPQYVSVQNRPPAKVTGLAASPH